MDKSVNAKTSIPLNGPGIKRKRSPSHKGNNRKDKKSNEVKKVRRSSVAEPHDGEDKSVNAKTSIPLNGPEINRKRSPSHSDNNRKYKKSNTVKKVRRSSVAEQYNGEEKPTDGENTDLTIKKQDSMIGSADSDKSSSGRKLLFHEAIGLEKKRLPIMEKKEKPTTEFSVPQLQKNKCVEASVVSLQNVRGQRRPQIISLIGELPKNKKKRKLSGEDGASQLNKKRCVKPIIEGFKYVHDVKEDVLENINHPVSNLSSKNSVKISEETKALAKNRETEAPIRCPDSIRFGYLKVKTWFSAQFPQEPDAKKLIFCEYCLKYTLCKSVFETHVRNCTWTSPPGTQIYRNGNLSVFEIDGKTFKIYCDTLCRIGKLFFNNKTLEYGVEQFRFYIMTKNDGFGNHLVGYFSKKKQRQDNFNVNCIIVMPQYQRKGYGRLLIEFSYLLSIIEKKPGTPETPLTVLGQKAYNSYWKSVILEYLEKYTSCDSIHINDVIRMTGLMGQDIINTFHSLNFVVEVFKKTTICIDWNVVDAHLQTKKLSKQVQIEREKLNWTP